MTKKNDSKKIELKKKLNDIDKKIKNHHQKEKKDKRDLKLKNISSKEYEKIYNSLNKKYSYALEKLIKEKVALENLLNEKTLEDINDKKENKLSVSKIARANNKPRPGKVDNPLKDPEHNVIEIRKVKKFYTTGKLAIEILKGIDLEIKKGDFCILFGKSGSGKSTLLNLISGLDRVTDGEIVINNKDITRMGDRQSTRFRRVTMGFIFQRYNLLPNLTAYENVETGAFLQKDKKRRLDIKELFKMMDIEEAMYKYPSEMSGGQQQRVSIARALVKNPDILFADEPTGALDEKMSAIVMNILQKINREYGTTIVMVSHNPAARKVANKSITLKAGKIYSIYKNKSVKNALEIKW